MATPSSTDSPAPRRRRRSGETRARLIDVCLDLIRAEGLGALTTQRVTEAAGISQPGFYKHFENLDALIAEAVGTVMQNMADQQAALHSLEMENVAELLTPEARRQTLASMLSIFVSEPRLAELYLRYRNDSTILGGAVTRIETEMVELGTRQYWEYAQRMGAKPGHYERVAIFTEHSLALYERAAEMILSGRYDTERVIDATNDALMAMGDQLLAELGASTEGATTQNGRPPSAQP